MSFHLLIKCDAQTASFVAEALTIQPTEQHRHRARIVSQTMSRPIDHSHLGGPMGFGQLSRVTGGHALVVVAMQQQKWTGREPLSRRNRPETT
jgi:hypothetical protein